MKQQRLADQLRHIEEAAKLAISYVDGMNKATFLADTRTQQAVVMNLIIIGEAATQILQDNPGFAAQHPQVPWHAMKGMRNRMAHGYFETNFDVVWATVQSALPALLQVLPRGE
jgi:uncharacterized protein with HEPN domain